MRDELYINSKMVSFYGPSSFNLKYDSYEELSTVLNNFFVINKYGRVVLNKKVLFKNNKSYKIIKEGIYTNDEGIHELRIIIDKELIGIVKNSLMQFEYKKENNSKKLLMK